ncbi:MAG TPA: cation diffusion facilitator family transporter, partial [Bryobacteraceae bacterium]|nr:cation diffusion facilitator family transporter [Bryobacteraceae bacterium]
LSPREVEEQTMIVVAALGIVLNLGIMRALHGHSSDVNVRAAWIHMLGDALGSVAIIVGALVIRSTGWMVIDPLLSILIAVVIIWTAWGIVRETLNVLLEGMPQGVELNAVTSAMRAVPGVLDVHDVHCWTLGSGVHALSCHALIADVPPSESDSILRSLNDTLGRRFGIRHTTVQFEHAPCPVGEKGCIMEHCSS